jgi:hypothetical protein
MINFRVCPYFGTHTRASVCLSIIISRQHTVVYRQFPRFHSSTRRRAKRSVNGPRDDILFLPDAGIFINAKAIPYDSIR